MLQPSTVHSRSRIARALRWAGENNRAERPRSRTSPFAAEDDGDDPAPAGEPAGLLGGDPVTGRGGGDTEAGQQGVEVEGDHHAGGGAAMGRQSGVGDVLQERHERLATSAGDRQRVDLTEWGASWRGVGVQVGPQPVRDMVGDAGVEVGRPVTTGSEVEPGRRLGAGLLGEQPLVLGLVGDLGGEVFEDTAAEVAQLPRPEHLGLLDQVGLGLDDQVVTQVVGQRVQRLDDHPRLGQVQITGTQSVGGPRPPRPERCSQRRVPAYGPVRFSGLGRQPGRGGPVTGDLGDVVGGREHSEPFALGAADQPRDPEQELLLLINGAELPD